MAPLTVCVDVAFMLNKKKEKNKENLVIFN